ncbi:PilW family protein [Neobacillus vireti]|uniref:PilW family protein n=1 Tax=Neobacillus vireti TaxID=220686 RepID=UPI002FFEDA81
MGEIEVDGMFKCEKGVTLVELLAALALISIIVLLASSIHLFGQKQMTVQSKEIQNQSDERLAMNIITKEIRKAQSVEVVAATNQLIINSTDVYTLVGTIIKKNGTTFLSNISKFEARLANKQLKLSIGNLPETIIYIRE